MAIFRLEDLGPSEEVAKMMAEDFQRRVDALNRFAAMLPPSPPPPWHKRIYYRVRDAVYRFRVRLGEIIAGQRFGDD